MSKKGFTLIELLVVIAIIALLASIVLGSFNQAKAKARDSKRIQDLQEVQKAVELYRADHGAYPNGSDPTLAIQTCPNSSSSYGICIDGSTSASASCQTDVPFFGSNYLGKYLKTVPHDPSKPAAGFSSNMPIYRGNVPGGYWYIVSANGQNYEIVALNTVENLAGIPTKLRGQTNGNSNNIVIRSSDNTNLLDGCFGS